MNPEPSTNEAILTISITASLLGIHPRTLMLYEQFNLIKPYRTKTNRRMYSVKDLEKLQLIRHLTHHKGINLMGVKLVLEALELSLDKGVDIRKQLFPTFEVKKLF